MLIIEPTVVMDLLEEKGFVPPDFVEIEVNWFYNDLGIDDSFFEKEQSSTILSHIHSLYAAKVAAYARDDKRLEIRLDKEATDHALYIDTSEPGISAIDGARYEQRIDEKYLDGSSSTRAYRVETFRSTSRLPTAGDVPKQQLRCYFIYLCDFENATQDPNETDLNLISDKRFLQKATKNTKAIYQEIIKVAVGTLYQFFSKWATLKNC